jgi:hypothetical protein
VPTRVEAATLALYALGGADSTVDTEDVAVELEKSEPGMFAWQKYRDRVDKELVRVALSDARLKALYTIGSHAKGWMLTAAGVDFARTYSATDGEPQVQRSTKDDELRRRERGRLIATDAYAKYARGELGAVSADEADAFFRINVYVRGQSREKKISRIENQFHDDRDLGELVATLAAIARERS